MNCWVQSYESGRFSYGEINERDDSGVTKKLFPCDIDLIRQTISYDPNISSTDVHKKLIQEGATFSLSTTIRAIKLAGFTSARYAQLESDANKVVRKDFCDNLLKVNDLFDDVIVTDESSIQLHCNKLTSYRPRQSVIVCTQNPNIP